MVAEGRADSAGGGEGVGVSAEGGATCRLSDPSLTSGLRQSHL